MRQEGKVTIQEEEEEKKETIRNGGRKWNIHCLCISKVRCSNTSVIIILCHVISPCTLCYSSALYEWSCLIPHSTPDWEVLLSSLFSDEEAEAHRSWITCPRSPVYTEDAAGISAQVGLTQDFCLFLGVVEKATEFMRKYCKFISSVLLKISNYYIKADMWK